MISKVVIIGAGVVGASIARVLSKYENLEIHLVERELDVGWGSSKANTGLLHPGHEEDPEKHPFRARLCIQGNKLWHQWVKELFIPANFPGELMVAFEDENFKALKKYEELGKRNGVPALRIVREEEIQRLEPNIAPDALGALWASTCGQLAPWEAVIALVENAVDNGVKLHLGTEVREIKIGEGKVKGLKTNRESIEADIIINAAGMYADKISKIADLDHFSIHPRKGEYYIFDEDATPKVVRIVHPTPTSLSKGVYVTTTVHGNLMIGPTAQDLPEDFKDDRSTGKRGLDFIWEWAKKLVRELPPKNKVIKSFAGLRPEPPNGDFLIEAYDELYGFINVAGIRSPGFTSAPAIAYYVKGLMEETFGVTLREKEKWNPYRKGILKIKDLPLEKQRMLIQQNPMYGNVVCMCKGTTEAEVVEAISRVRKIGATMITLDSIKYRTLALFGTCQGSFCRLPMTKIISKETGIPMWKITLKGCGTEYGIGDVKVLQRRGEDE
jgi:glycerol-3-phosphate dehydrogenase